jgi:hypothetical protein
MASAAHPPALRTSLREFLTFVAVVAIACATLCYANAYWLMLVSFVALLGVIATGVNAFVDRGPRQAAAIGALVAITIYATLIYTRQLQTDRNPSFNPEFDPYSGALPTTLVLRPIFEAISEQQYLDNATGKRVSASKLPTDATIEDPNEVFRRQQTGRSGSSAAATHKRLGEFPSRDHFMPVAHYLWALLFAYAAAKLARYVYARRLREEAAP